MVTFPGGHRRPSAIWFTMTFGILPGLFDFASPVTVSMMFSLTAWPSISYVIPIALRRIYQHHPEVQFKPGPFYMDSETVCSGGWLTSNVLWTLFVPVMFSFPAVMLATKDTMNYGAVITGGILLAMYVHHYPLLFAFLGFLLKGSPSVLLAYLPPGSGTS